MPNHTIAVVVLIALIVGANPVLKLGWGPLGRQEGLTPTVFSP